MKQQRQQIDGWINLDKPLHMSSARAVAIVKRLTHAAKVGHAGTLDPLATGVLPLCLGKATKSVNLLMDAQKTYEFLVTFGERRSTDDAEGEVIATSGHIPNESAIREILPRFTGEIEQLPPIFSALKVDGKRAYDLARAGQAVELKPRQVTVYKLEFLGYKDAAREALSPCGRGLGEGASNLRAYVPLAQQEQTTDRAQALRHDSTEAEKKLWNALRSRQLDGLKFRRQHPVERYIVDFICLEQRLIIELDGGQHAEHMKADEKRTAYLESQGFRVIRFWNNEVMENFEGVYEAIRSQISYPLTQPSPAGGEGSFVAPLEPNDAQLSMLKVSNTAHFRATVSKGTYIRSLGRDMAQALGSEGYISRLHRAQVGPFADAEAISLDFLEESVHKAPGQRNWLITTLDGIPAAAIQKPDAA